MHHVLQKCVTKTQDDYFEYRQFYIAVFSFCRLLFSKSYMRFKSWSFKDRKRSIQRIVSDLEMLLLYVHIDEMVYSKLCRTVLLTGVFHKLRVKRWLIYKCFNYIGIKEWRIHGVFGPAIPLVKWWQLVTSRDWCVIYRSWIMMMLIKIKKWHN